MQERLRGGGNIGRIRLCDDSLKYVGYKKGQIVLIKLGGQPQNGDLCAAFLPTGDLRIRYFHRESNGDIRLTKGTDSKLIQVLAPRAVMIFGTVVGVERGGGQ